MVVARADDTSIVNYNVDWFCAKFTLNLENIEDFFTRRGLDVSCETVRS